MYDDPKRPMFTSRAKLQKQCFAQMDAAERMKRPDLYGLFVEIALGLDLLPAPPAHLTQAAKDLFNQTDR